MLNGYKRLNTGKNGFDAMKIPVEILRLSNSTRAREAFPSLVIKLGMLSTNQKPLKL